MRGLLTFTLCGLNLLVILQTVIHSYYLCPYTILVPRGPAGLQPLVGRTSCVIQLSSDQLFPHPPHPYTFFLLEEVYHPAWGYGTYHLGGVLPPGSVVWEASRLLVTPT